MSPALFPPFFNSFTSFIPWLFLHHLPVPPLASSCPPSYFLLVLLCFLPFPSFFNLLFSFLIPAFYTLICFLLFSVLRLIRVDVWFADFDWTWMFLCIAECDCDLADIRSACNAPWWHSSRLKSSQQVFVLFWDFIIYFWVQRQVWSHRWPPHAMNG